MSADRVFFESLAGPLLTGMMTIVIFGVVAFPMSLLFKIGKKSISSLIRSFVLRSVLSMVFLFVIFPYGFDKVSNRVDKKYLDLLILENKNAQQVHDSIPFIADLHADTLMWKHRGSFLKSEMGHVTLSKMQKSNMALQTFAVVNSIPHTLNMQYNVNYTDIFPFLMFAQLYERESWFSPLYRARAMSRLLQSYEDEGNGVVTFIKNQQNLENFLERRKTNKNLVSGLLSVEGAQVLEYDLDNVQKLFDWGVRMFGLNHFTDNQVGGSLHGSEKYGLSEFGKKVIKKVIDLNMIIDMAHASESHMKDVLDLTESWNTTVIVSHTGVKSDCNHTRNISEEVAKRVAKRGGVMGIAFFEFTTCGAGFKSVAKTMKHLANLVGVDHIALGSDWDGAINAFGSAEHLVFLTDALISEGFNQEEINKIMGGNVLRVLRSSLPK